MGLFTKKGKEAKGDAQVAVLEKKESKLKQKKPAKAKKSLFGGKKKDVTLLERMQLEESVAAASLDVVQELAEIGESAVRETEEGLLIIVITNEMLEQAGLDPAGEEFGSFAQALRSETIESIALSNDLEAGVIGLIPSKETLISLDEFDFVHDIEFRWALVPFDLGDDDRLTVLDSTVHVDRLMEMANNPEIQIAIKNGEVVEAEAEYDEADNAPDGDGVDDDEFDNELDETPVYGTQADDDDFDEIDDFDDDFDEIDDFDDDEAFDEPVFEATDNLDDEFDVEDDQSYGTAYDQDDMPYDDTDTVSDDSFIEEDEGLTAEETREVITQAATHGFNNTELGLAIDMTKFDDYFNVVNIAKFDTARTDNSELQNVLSKLRQDANVELERFHQDNIQSLRNKFTTSMRDIHNKLVESLDHKDEQTTYGRRHYEIESDYDDAMGDLDRRVAGETAGINKLYNEQREEYAENAKREALAVYDSRYRDERNRKIESAKDFITTDLKTTRDTELGELYKDRRTVAQRLFDKAMTALLQKLQEEHQSISQKELQMYDAFRKSMDVYLRKHFADEVLRAKAEAEKLKQSHEAERVRAEYEQMLMTKTRALGEADELARENLRKLEVTHKEQIDHVKADYERRIEREQRENQNLREMLQDANASNGKIGEQKEEEVKHRMNMYKDALEAKERELAYANERANTAQKPMKMVFGAVAVVMLAAGIIFGFMFGTNSMQIAPASTEVTQPPVEDVSYNDVESSNAVNTIGGTINWNL